MTIDWINPSEDICEAKRIGYNEAKEADELIIAGLKDTITELEHTIKNLKAALPNPSLLESLANWLYKYEMIMKSGSQLLHGKSTELV